jgi:hypothetical protein
LNNDRHFFLDGGPTSDDDDDNNDDNDDHHYHMYTTHLYTLKISCIRSSIVCCRPFVAGAVPYRSLGRETDGATNNREGEEYPAHKKNLRRRGRLITQQADFFGYEWQTREWFVVVVVAFISPIDHQQF